MSKITARRSFLLSSDIGNVLVTQEVVEGYDVEDIVSDRAYSQAMAVKFINQGKQIDPNAPTAARTLGSTYLNNQEVLSDG